VKLIASYSKRIICVIFFLTFLSVGFQSLTYPIFSKNVKNTDLLDKACIVDNQIDYIVCLINDLQVTMDSKLDDISSKVDELHETMDSKLDDISSKVDELFCNITESKTIDQPGVYCLANDVNGNIVIDSDNVVLDLSGYRISSDNTLLSITSGCKNIVIRNGTLHAAENGLYVEPGVHLVRVDKLNIYDCQNGINMQGTELDKIKGVKISETLVMTCTTAVKLTHVNKSIFENVEALNFTEHGFDLQFSNYNEFKNCKALDAISDDPTNSIVGFSTSGGVGNNFVECIAKGIEKTESYFGVNAVGFLLAGTDTQMEIDTKIIDSIVSSIKNTGTSGDAYGIYFDPVLLSGADLLSVIDSFNHGDTIYFVNWSPDGQYLAIRGTQGHVVFTFVSFLQ